MAVVHVFTCPPGQQGTYNRDFGTETVPQCAAGQGGTWTAIEIPEGVTNPWQPTIQEVADLATAAVLVLGVAWGFSVVRRFTFGRR